MPKERLKEAYTRAVEKSETWKRLPISETGGEWHMGMGSCYCFFTLEQHFSCYLDRANFTTEQQHIKEVYRIRLQEYIRMVLFNMPMRYWSNFFDLLPEINGPTPRPASRKRL